MERAVIATRYQAKSMAPQARHRMASARMRRGMAEKGQKTTNGVKERAITEPNTTGLITALLNRRNHAAAPVGSKASNRSCTSSMLGSATRMRKSGGMRRPARAKKNGYCVKRVSRGMKMVTIQAVEIEYPANAASANSFERLQQSPREARHRSSTGLRVRSKR